MEEHEFYGGTTPRPETFGTNIEEKTIFNDNYKALKAKIDGKVHRQQSEQFEDTINSMNHSVQQTAQSPQAQTEEIRVNTETEKDPKYVNITVDGETIFRHIDIVPKVEQKRIEVSKEEFQTYWDMLEEKHGRKLKDLTVDVDGDYVDLHYKFEPVEFDRIRRITGYLVGNTEKWNDSKKAELADRVTHGGMKQLESEEK